MPHGTKTVSKTYSVTANYQYCVWKKKYVELGGIYVFLKSKLHLFISCSFLSLDSEIVNTSDIY
jgi:hypothetical protein